MRPGGPLRVVPQQDNVADLPGLHQAQAVRSWVRGRVQEPGRGFGAAATRQASAVWSGHYVAGKTLSEAAGKRSKHVADLMQAGAGAATIKQSMDHAALLAGENVVATQQATQAVALVAQGQARREMQEMQERQARIENLLMTLTRGMRHDSL